MNKFVLSTKEFETIKEAENKVNGWFQSGDLTKGTRLYEVKSAYYLKLKFVKRKEPK